MVNLRRCAFARAGVYLANQLDGKIFDQPGLMPTKQSYSDFVQTKVRPRNLPCVLHRSVTP